MTEDLKLKARMMVRDPQAVSPAARAMGMRVKAASRGRSKVEVTLGSEHLNAMGTAHGGVLTTLADLAMGVATMTTLSSGESFATVEIKVSFLRSVASGKVTGEGVVVQRGQRLVFAQATLRDQKNRKVAMATSTALLLRVDKS